MRAGKTEKHNRQIPTLMLKINVCVVVHKNGAMDVDHDSMSLFSNNTASL